MNTPRLRKIARQGGTPGLLLAGAALALHALWSRPKTRCGLLLAALLGGTLFLFLPRPGDSGGVAGGHLALARDAPAAYSVTDLGTLKGGPTAADGIGEGGHVVGASQTGEESARAFLWHKSRMADLGTLGGSFSMGLDVNAGGQALAASLTRRDEGIASFLWKDGKRTELGNLGVPFTLASSLNDDGLAVGVAADSNMMFRPFVWRKGKMFALPGLPGLEQGFATDINNRPMAVGYCFDEAGNVKAALWDGKGDGAKPLPGIGGPQTIAYALNNSGQAVGAGLLSEGRSALSVRPAWLVLSAKVREVAGQRVRVQTPFDTGEAEFHAILWQEGKAVDLGALPGAPNSLAFDINDRGQVVGVCVGDSGDPVPFLWRAGKMEDLNALRPANSGWKLITATGVNGKGEICGTGYYKGEVRAYLLKPGR